MAAWCQAQLVALPLCAKDHRRGQRPWQPCSQRRCRTEKYKDFHGRFACRAPFRV